MNRKLLSSNQTTFPRAQDLFLLFPTAAHRIKAENKDDACHTELVAEIRLNEQASGVLESLRAEPGMVELSLMRSTGGSAL